MLDYLIEPLARFALLEYISKFRKYQGKVSIKQLVLSIKREDWKSFSNLRGIAIRAAE